VTDLLEVTLLVTDSLDAHGIRYTVGGSLASSFSGEPRASIDADVVGADRIAFERLGGAIPALSVKRNDCARAPGGSRIPAAFRGRTEYLRITRRSSYPIAKSD